MSTVKNLELGINPIFPELSDADLVPYAFLERMHLLIEKNKVRTKRAKEPRCLCIMGSQGAGKTTIVLAYAIQHPPFEDENGWTIPVLYVETPDEATRKGLCSAMLYYLGDPGWDKGDRLSKTFRLKKLLQKCKVEVVILDDLQHILRESDVNMKQAAEWLKQLIKITNIPFVVVGIEDEIGTVLKLDKQLARLFGNPKSLKPFKWTKGFGDFVDMAEKVIGMHLSEEIDRDEILFRIFYATDGRIGPIMDLLRDAADTALDRKANQIRLGDLSYAFNTYWKDYLGKKYNPFISNEANIKQLEEDVAQYAKTAKESVNPEKGKEISLPISQVLSK
jgi:hypothetical protein